MYIHERDGWPALEWDQPKLGVLVSGVRHRQGRLLGRMEALGFELRDEATLRSLTQDVVKSSEIEGETLDVSPWIEWYMRCLKTAIAASEITLETVLAKARFWKIQSGHSLNERQRTMLNRLLDGFEGKLTSSKWASLAKCSQDTALRDLSDPLARGILKKEDAGGRSTHYQLQVPKAPIHEPDGIEPIINRE